MQMTGTDARSRNFGYNIGFVGGSRAGTAFANYLTKSGLNVQGFYSYNFDSAITSAKITKTKAYTDLESLVFDSDIIFISVKDIYIQDVWQQVRQFNLFDKIICHLSGFLSSHIFDHSGTFCKGVASLHIPISFARKEIIPKEIKSAVFVVEGDACALDVLSKVSLQTNNQMVKINTIAKTKYHAACVFSSSLTLALLKNASNIIEDSLDENNRSAISERLVLNLASSAITNSILNNDIMSNITGPIIRNDTTTVTKHLEVLTNQDNKILYKMLSNFLLENINLETQQKIDFQNILQVDTCLN